ncbi:MAG: hypothetical protein ACKOWF_11540 [Chloroflexota bacterium]
MPNGYRIFVSGQYRGLEVAETPEEAVTAYLRDPRRLVPVDKVRAEPWDQRIARYRLTFDGGGHSIAVEVDAFDEGIEDAEYRARRVLRAETPHLADAPLLAREKLRVYPMAARILPFPGADRDQ